MKWHVKNVNGMLQTSYCRSKDEIQVQSYWRLKFNYLRTSSRRPATDGWFVITCCEAEEGNFPKSWPNTSTDDPKQYKGLVECQTHQYKTEQRCQNDSQHSNPIGQWEEEDWRTYCTYSWYHVVRIIFQESTKILTAQSFHYFTMLFALHTNTKSA